MSEDVLEVHGHLDRPAVSRERVDDQEAPPRHVTVHAPGPHEGCDLPAEPERRFRRALARAGRARLADLTHDELGARQELEHRPGQRGIGLRVCVGVALVGRRDDPRRRRRIRDERVTLGARRRVRRGGDTRLRREGDRDDGRDARRLFRDERAAANAHSASASRSPAGPSFSSASRRATKRCHFLPTRMASSVMRVMVNRSAPKIASL